MQRRYHCITHFVVGLTPTQRPPVPIVVQNSTSSDQTLAFIHPSTVAVVSANKVLVPYLWIPSRHASPPLPFLPSLSKTPPTPPKKKKKKTSKTGQRGRIDCPTQVKSAQLGERTDGIYRSRHYMAWLPNNDNYLLRPPPCQKTSKTGNQSCHSSHLSPRSKGSPKWGQSESCRRKARYHLLRIRSPSLLCLVQNIDI